MSDDGLACEGGSVAEQPPLFSIDQLERMVSQASSPEEVETAVDRLYQTLPIPQHKAHAMRVSQHRSSSSCCSGSCSVGGH